MKVLLRRDQKAGMMGMGKIAFTLTIRAELEGDEKAHIEKYNLGSTCLYVQRAFTPGEKHKNNPAKDAGDNLLLSVGKSLWELVRGLLFKARNLTVSVDDLSKGKQIECKNIVEMLAVEGQLKEACETFKQVLTAAASFGGEEVLNY